MVPVHLQCIDSRPMSLKPTATPSWQVNTLLASSLKRDVCLRRTNYLCRPQCRTLVPLRLHCAGRRRSFAILARNPNSTGLFWRAAECDTVGSSAALMQHSVLLLALYAYIKCSDGRWASRVAALPASCSVTLTSSWTSCPVPSSGGPCRAAGDEPAVPRAVGGRDPGSRARCGAAREDTNWQAPRHAAAR